MSDCRAAVLYKWPLGWDDGVAALDLMRWDCGGRPRLRTSHCQSAREGGCSPRTPRCWSSDAGARWNTDPGKKQRPLESHKRTTNTRHASPLGWSDVPSFRDLPWWGREGFRRRWAELWGEWWPRWSAWARPENPGWPASPRKPGSCWSAPTCQEGEHNSLQKDLMHASFSQRKEQGRKYPLAEQFNSQSLVLRGSTLMRMDILNSLHFLRLIRYLN